MWRFIKRDASVRVAVKLGVVALLTLPALPLLTGCAPSAAPPPGDQTPLPSVFPHPISSSLVPDAVSTSPYAPNPISSVAPTLTPTPTRDPRLPTYTPTPTSTPSLTPTPYSTPILILLTDGVPDPQMPDVRYFPSTGHTLRGVFLDYWQGHGGAAELGYPITEEFVESAEVGGYNVAYGKGIATVTVSVNGGINGKDKLPVVQYFEKVRLEIPSGDATSPQEVHVTPGGAQLARQKGYYSGLYPRYGRAVDFSWVSGQLIMHRDINCLSTDCGCSILRYEGKDDIIGLQGNAWWIYVAYNPVGSSYFFVAFGRVRLPNESGRNCRALPHDPKTGALIATFDVERAQLNPAP